MSAGAATRFRRWPWLAQLALPLVGLWLLRTNPELDTRLEHHAGHFWLVVIGALLNVVLGVWVSEAARRRHDARLLLVSLTFLASAGFLLLHALATPAVLLPGPNTGFAVATPFGLLLGAGFAVASSANLTEARAAAVLRQQWWLRGSLALVMVAWAVLSLLALPPFASPLAEDSAHRLVHGLALEATVRHINEQYEAAVRTLVEELRDRPETGAEPLEELVGRVARRYELGRGQQGVLGRAAGEIDALLAEQPPRPPGASRSSRSSAWPTSSSSASCQRACRRCPAGGWRPSIGRLAPSAATSTT